MNQLKDNWRAIIALTYCATCIFDFIAGPLITMYFHIYTKTALVAWKSLTLENGGLYHLAMGAILGAAAWTNGQTNTYKAILDRVTGNQPQQQEPPTEMPKSEKAAATKEAEKKPANTVMETNLAAADKIKQKIDRFKS